MARLTLYFLVLSCFLSACGNEEEPTIDIADEFQVYVDTFEQEAAKRGLEDVFSERGIQVRFGDPNALQFGNPEFFAGYCDIVSDPPIVNINQATWNVLIERNKEFVIFHELGHCLWERQHINDLLPNGELKSMMVGGDFENSVGNKVINFSGLRRDYYIDELFDESISPPDWSTETFTYEAISGLNKRLLEELVFDSVNNKWLPDTHDCLFGIMRDETLVLENTCAEPQEIIRPVVSYNNINFEIELEIKIAESGRINFVWGGLNEAEQMQLGIEKSGLISLSSKDEQLGTFALIEVQDWQVNDKNLINIISQNNRYSLFVNGQMRYVNDYYEFAAGMMGFEIEDANVLTISKLNLFELE